MSSVDGTIVDAGLLLLLALDEPGHAVERDAAIVADDPAAAVGVRQSGEDVRAAAAPHVGRVGVEDAVVVRLAVLGEGLDDVRVGLVAVGFQGSGDHPEAAVRHDRAPERRFGLQPDDDFVVAVDVARGVGGDGARDLGDIEHALAALFGEEVGQLFPDRGRALRRRREEVGVAVVGRVILLDEVANVDLVLPQAFLEALPGRSRVDGFRIRYGRSHE